MESVLKLKLNLSEESKRVLDGQSKILNWLFNQLLEKANGLRELYKKDHDPEVAKQLYGQRSLRNLIPSMKEEHPFLRSVHSSPLKNAALRLSESIGAYQKSRKGKRKGCPTGFPKFRSHKRKFFSLLYDEPGKGFKISGRDLKISLGCDENKKRFYLEGEMEKSPNDFENKEIRNLRLTKECDEYFAIFTVASSEPPKREIKKVISLDPNHKNLSYGVDTDGVAIEIENPWFMKGLQKRIDQVKSQRDKKKRKSQKIEKADGRFFWLPSRRYGHLDKKLENLYRIRREQTKTFLYTISHYLCRNYDLISIGDYVPRGGGITKGMRRAMNNESLIGRFKDILAWTAKKSGKLSVEWDEKGSTRTCYHCGYVMKEGISPDIRIWQCPNEACGKVHYRDENAALNGLKRTTEKWFPGSGRFVLPLEIDGNSRWALRFTGLGLKRKLLPGISVR